MSKWLQEDVLGGGEGGGGGGGFKTVCMQQ